MTAFRCKKCGGQMNVPKDAKTVICDYCGVELTLPKLDNEEKVRMYDRANHFRRNNEYDKAKDIFEKILMEDNTDAESYWSLVLCDYGIEYVEDPLSYKRVPTINRVQYTSIYDDENYKSALMYASPEQKIIYEEEAKYINNVQKRILEISKKEKPYDVFICYKETDDSGARTLDSVLATELYERLTKEDLKVFFSRITLEDKLGKTYEPYIFSALNSSKVMIVLGTKPEYFNAVWVKNEWSRYLKILKKDPNKLLIPVYKDMDPYDLPLEMSHIQAQDMTKMGFELDLVRAVKKVVGKSNKNKLERIAVSKANTVSNLLKRAYISLEDGEWIKANNFCETVLNKEPENPVAYLGILLAENRCHNKSDLEVLSLPFSNSVNYKRTIRYCSDELRKELEGYNAEIIKRNENAKLLAKYNGILEKKEKAMTTEELRKVGRAFNEIADYENSKELSEDCMAKANEIDYCQAVDKFNNVSNNEDYLEAKKMFDTLSNYKDSKELSEKCQILHDKLLKEEKEKCEENQRCLKIRDNAVSTLSKYSNLKDLKNTINDLKTVPEDFMDTKELLNKLENKSFSMKFKRVRNSIIFIAIFSFVLCCFIIPKIMQKSIDKALENNDYVKAYSLTISPVLETIDIFDIMNEDYQIRYFAKEGMISRNLKVEEDNDFVYGITEDGRVEFCGNNDFGQAEVNDWTDIVDVETNGYYTVGLKKDGSVIATGDNSFNIGEFKDWENVKQIVMVGNNTIGLRADGKAYVMGGDTDLKEKMSKSSNLKSISKMGHGAIGLSNDGSVCLYNYNSIDYNVSNWKNIDYVEFYEDIIIGVGKNGVVCAGNCDESLSKELSKWKNIKSVTLDSRIIVGIDKLGNVNVALRKYDEDGDKIIELLEDWHNIATVCIEPKFIVGLKTDGKIEIIGNNDYDVFDSYHWNDIVAIETESYSVIGLKSNGGVIATGEDRKAQIHNSKYYNRYSFKIPDVMKDKVKFKIK